MSELQDALEVPGAEERWKQQQEFINIVKDDETNL